MARKYDLISELYNRTCKAVVNNSECWQRFLSSACRNYKLRFDEQLLVYAQRPDATAVLEIERWNGSFGRWVNRGATGIAVFADADRNKPYLIHYFDISDTHESRFSRPVPLWKMKPEYEEAIIETLEGTFGDIENKHNLETAIINAAENATEDNLPDYTRDLLYTVEGSILEDLDEQNVTVMFRKLVSNSVAYMMMERLGLNTDNFFEWDDFQDIVNFNTPATLNALGFATSDIAEMGLAEISKTVMSIEKQNRIIAEKSKSDYNKDRNKNTERSYDNEQTDLHNAGRLQSPEPDTSRTTRSTDGTLRTDEGEVPERTPQGSVLQSSDELHTQSALGGNRADSDRDAGTLDQGNGGEGRRNGNAESDRYDEVGTDDEQYPQQSNGNRDEGSNLRLDYYDRSNEDKSLPFFGGDDTIREILGTTPHLKASKDEIRAFFETVADDDKRTEYIKSIFNNDYTEVILSDDRRVGYKTYQNVLHLWEGSYLSRTAQSFYDWGVIADHFEAMRLLGELQDKMKPLPSQDGQMSLMLDYEAEVTKPSAFSFSQEIIDTVLCSGSGVSEGKFRIYEQFQKSLSKKENADFLKNEYGWGGRYPIISGTGIDELHDGKGIKISKRVNGKDEKILLKWNQVEKRISELIKMDRYLNPKEKELYPQWLEQQEIRRAETEERRRTAEILNTAPPEEKTKEEPETADRYEYHLGNSVYIGANEYEILSFDDERVMLYDKQFPLFNKEFTREEFDRKVAENPMNDHLKVQVARVEQDKSTLPFTSGDTHYFYRPDSKRWDVVYYNPDADAGGQYVVTRLSLDDVIAAKENSNSVESFFDIIGQSRNYELIDKGTPEFDAFIREYSEMHPDRIGDDEGTMATLVSQAESEIEQVPISNREIGILNNVLYRLRIDDIDFEYDDNGLVAKDYDGNVWHGAEFYKFLVDEVFVFRDDGSIAKIDGDLYQNFKELSEQNGVLVKDNRVKQPYRGYLEVKAEYPDTFVFYQVGDFFESYNDDAQKAADIFDLFVTSRPIRDNERVPMFGIPKHRLETYMTMLTDRGYDVVVASLENGERKIYNLTSQSKEDPVESKPIGRINYLHTNGTVRESIEYTSEYSFKKDIQNENSYGVPMTVDVYTDKDGNKIDTAFLYECDPPLQGVQVITSPYIQVNPLEKAKEIIDDFCRNEYERDDGADYSDLSNVEVAYTTTEDEKHEIQAKVNLVDFKIETTVDGVVVRREEYSSIDDLIENGLQGMSFDDLVYVSEEQLAPFYEQADDFSDIDTVAVREALAESGIVNGEVVDAEKLEISPFVAQVKADVEQSVSIKPAWEQKQKSRVQSYDLHPEIPMSERYNFDLANNEIEEVGKKERFRRNMEAIKVLKECEFDNRFATPEEQVILSKYVGWGGIPEAFDERNGAWANEFIELYEALSPEEYERARESTLTAFYTPPTVIKAVYKAMEQMGFSEGNILEPSCGIGHFIGMMPDSMKESKIYGVELDTISAGIAQQLYQKTSIAAQGFEEANLPDSFFDSIVGNVPFGDYKVPDKRYDKHKFLIHDYFFAKSLDKLRPGGVMALITSKGTMDKENSAVRKYIAQRADLLGAIRLPNDTFKGNAGTEVVSDILILQKRDRLIDIEPDWVHLGTDENGIKMNSYFVDHPEMILGEMKMVSGRFGPEPSCLPYENADLEEQLAEAISNIHGQISEYEVEEELTEEDNSIPADPTVRNFSYTVVDDKIYFRENSRMTPVDVSATAENRIKGMISIRDSVRKLIELQTEDFPDYEIKAEQENLNRLYDTFSSKYGLINSRANTSAFSQDSSYSLLSALEILGDDGQLERKADMFFKRTIKPHIPITSVDTSSEALAVAMGEKAWVDMEYMSELSGKSEEELFADLKGVIFLNPLYEYGEHPESKYLMADEYLSGNVREKLKIAKKSAEIYPEDYSINVDALEKVQPTDLTASEISVRLGATWLPPEIAEQFMFEFLGTPRYAQWNIKVHFSKYTGEWNIEGKSYDRGNVKAYNTYGTSRINAYKIIEETLNLKDVRIFDYIEDDEGKKKAVLNKKETAIAQAKQELIKQGFQDWIWSDPDRRQRLCKMYNEKFNSIRPREYDGSHITFSGMNPEIDLREHQRNAVAHILYGGNTLLAHAVGAGKTFEMTAAAMESKRLGLCNKSLFVVPNHLTEQWAAEFLQLYPSANILVATKKDFEMKNRKRFCGRIATGDYDAVIIGHSQFEKIPMSIERQRAILEQQIDEITLGIADLKQNRGDTFSVKQLERTRKSVKQKLEKLNDQSRKDDVVTFEELGVDRLFIDESHYYKNLFLYTKMRNVGGIAQTEAQKSSDLFMKCRYLDEITGGRGTVFATGTPISNSMVELYTIQRYLQYNTLVENNLQHFDAWASTFGETVTAVELTPEGTGYRAKTRFARFYNLPELMSMFKEVADIKTADMLNLPVPKAVFHNISVKPSEIQKEMVASLAERAEKVRNGMVDASVDNMLKITNDGRKLALDQRLLNPLLALKNLIRKNNEPMLSVATTKLVFPKRLL